MKYEIPSEHLALLQQYGFGQSPDCDLLGAFSHGDLAMDTHMEVSGDHATDHAYIYYAITQTNEGELEGLFYAPSLLEYLPMEFPEDWKPARLLAQVNVQLEEKAKIVHVGGFPMFYLPIENYDWEYDGLRTVVSDMLKLVARTDYLLSRKWNALMAKRHGNA